MHSKLMKFLDAQKILHLKKIGFQKKKISKSHAIFSLIKNIQKSVEVKQITLEFL